MGIKELVDNLVKSSKAWTEAEVAFKPFIYDEFATYLDQRPEISKEDFVVMISNKNRNAGSETTLNGGIPYVQIILGKGGETDTPRNVTSEFKNFVLRYKPLEIEVLRYFTPFEGFVKKTGTF